MTVAVLIWVVVGYTFLSKNKRSQEQVPRVGPEASSPQGKVKRQAESLIAASQHDPNTDSSIMRSVCTGCGAWSESPSFAALALNSPGTNHTSNAKRPFFIQHLEQCRKEGGAMRAVYPDEPDWSKLDPKKRVD